MGAHVLWNNKESVGVSVMGNFETSPLLEDQKASVKNMVAFLREKYGITVTGLSDAHKECPKNGDCLIHDFQTDNLVGHRDVGFTTCPGKDLYSVLPSIKVDYANESKNVLIANTKTNAPPSVSLASYNSVTPDLISETLGKTPK